MWISDTEWPVRVQLSEANMVLIDEVSEMASYAKSAFICAQVVNNLQQQQEVLPVSVSIRDKVPNKER